MAGRERRCGEDVSATVQCKCVDWVVDTCLTHCFMNKVGHSRARSQCDRDSSGMLLFTLAAPVPMLYVASVLTKPLTNSAAPLIGSTRLKSSSLLCTPSAMNSSTVSFSRISGKCERMYSAAIRWGLPMTPALISQVIVWP